MDLSKRIKELRLAKGIRTNVMARGLNICSTNYIRIEKRSKKNSIEMLEKIADVLGVSLIELLNPAYKNEVLESNEFITEDLLMAFEEKVRDLLIEYDFPSNNPTINISQQTSELGFETVKTYHIIVGGGPYIAVYGDTINTALQRLELDLQNQEDTI